MLLQSSQTSRRVARSGAIGYDYHEMTHEYEGHYRAKYGADLRLDPALAKCVHEKATDGHLTCASAFSISEKTGAGPAEVGRAADLLEIKITQCQLGLFGHMKERRNIVEPAKQVSMALEQAIQDRLISGKLPCKEAWEVAKRFGLSKIEITGACERLNIRLGPCQLGTF